MHAKPTTATRRSTNGRGGSRRKPALALVPDLALEQQKQLKADARARAALAAAATAGEPLLTATGAQRSPITLPEYRLGRAPANKGKKYDVDVPTRGDVDQLLAACSRRSSAGIRTRALIVLLYRSGLRIAEALALYPKDVNLELGTAAVLHGKGNQRRVVGIDAQALGLLEAWLERRRELGIGSQSPIFCTMSGSTKGRRMHPSVVREGFKDLAHKAGIEKRIHPHAFRHAHATELARECVPIHLIQRQLGHADLATTEHYIDHLTPWEVIDAIRNRGDWMDEPQTVRRVPAALSRGMAPASAVPMPPLSLDPPEPAKAQERKPAPQGEREERVFQSIIENGGEATTGGLCRALDIKPKPMLEALRRLQEQRRIVRAGLDSHRSYIWRIAPPPVRVSRVPDRPFKCAPNGEGTARVFDALDSFGGRASQAQVAQRLGLSINTVHSHFLQLAREGFVERGGLDKTTSRRGSQVWCVRGPAITWNPARIGTMTIGLPRS